MTDHDIIIKRNTELSVVLGVSKVLTSSFDLESNLNSAMTILSENLDMRRACVFLMDEDSIDLNIVAAHGLTVEEIRRGKYRIGEGVVGRIMESGRTMFIPDIGDEPMFLNRTGRQHKKGISFICVPIRMEDRVLGVLSVDRIYSDEHGSVEDDLRVLEIISSLLAQFVMLWRSYRKVEHEKETLSIQLRDRYSLPNIIGESERFTSVLKSVRKVAPTEASVLLLGESGTGKELVASTIHFQSQRADGPFVAVNCAALPENLLEVELFGSEKGAFTGATARRKGRFELAEGGTIFLDEIGEMPLNLQSKLLRVLQSRTFERVGSSVPIKADIRVIAATNRDLAREVSAGRFREDLYWRLNVVPILLPPLRDRRSDVPSLVEFYMGKFNSAYGKKTSLSQPAMNMLCEYDWPGNVRELANMIERMVILAEADSIAEKDIPIHTRVEDVPVKHTDSVANDVSLTGEVESIEKHYIIKALKESGYVQHRAARALGLTARQMGYKIRKYNISMESLKG